MPPSFSGYSGGNTLDGGPQWSGGLDFNVAAGGASGSPVGVPWLPILAVLAVVLLAALLVWRAF